MVVVMLVLAGRSGGEGRRGFNAILLLINQTLKHPKKKGRGKGEGQGAAYQR